MNFIVAVPCYCNEDYQEINMTKLKVIILKIAGNRQVLLCQLDIWLIFFIISTCCAHHVVYFKLVVYLWLVW